jgi:hypothetical protein
VCSSPYEALLFAAAFSMACHGFLRVGEIVFTKLGRDLKLSDCMPAEINALRKTAEN